jgi:hypothetical protein
VVPHPEATIQRLFEQALAAPEQADFKRLWQEIEPALLQMSVVDHLRVGGWAIARLADLHHQRAMQWLSDWEAAEVETEPLIEEDWLNELIQQTMHLDLSELTRQPKPHHRKEPSQKGADSSIAREVEKAKLLDFVDAYDEEGQMQETLAIAHDEEVSVWIEITSKELRNWIEPLAPKVTFTQLIHKIGEHHPQMTIVKVWLALLLGGYELEQQGDFYLSEIWISRDTVLPRFIH